MKQILVLLVATIALIILSGCTQSPQIPADLKDCGKALYSTDLSDAANQCFVDAFKKCEPAKLTNGAQEVIILGPEGNKCKIQTSFNVPELAGKTAICTLETSQNVILEYQKIISNPSCQGSLKDFFTSQLGPSTNPSSNCSQFGGRILINDFSVTASGINLAIQNGSTSTMSSITATGDLGTGIVNDSELEVGTKTTISYAGALTSGSSYILEVSYSSNGINHTETTTCLYFN